MTTTAFHLRTILTWAEHSATGEPCVGLTEWLATVPDAHAQWQLVNETLAELRRGEWPLSESALTIDEVARYVDEWCDADEAQRIERACWKSKGDLQEVLSGLRFRTQSRVLLARTVQLSERLAALVPATATAKGQLAQTNSTTPTSSVESREAGNDLLVIDTPLKIATAGQAFALDSRRGNFRSHRRREWPLAVGLAAALIVVIVGIGWFHVTRRSTNEGQAPVATGQDSTGGRPKLPGELDGKKRSSRSPDAFVNDRMPGSTRDIVEPKRDVGENPLPGHRTEGSGDSIVKAPEPAESGGDLVPPKERTDAVRVAPLEVAVKSATGLVLVRSDAVDPWRVGQGKYSLQSPLQVVSVSESWTETQIPGMGTLVMAGESAATVSQGTDGVLQVALEQGHVGIRDLPARQRVRWEMDGLQWTADGLDSYSSMALVRNLDAPHLLVSAGSITVDSVRIAQDEVSTLGNGGVTPPQALSLKAAEANRPLGTNPFDTRWLLPPADRVRREWEAQNSKLVTRLAAADDVVAEIGRMRAAGMSGSQNALLARWNLMLAADAAEELWLLMNDRQEFVRRAGVSYLLETHPRSVRFRELTQGIRRHTGDAITQAIIAWLIRVYRNQPVTAAAAMELVEGLNHQELAVRQVAASLLELQTRDAFRQAKRKAPAYDADWPMARRVAAQAQWNAIVMQLFPATRRSRNGT